MTIFIATHGDGQIKPNTKEQETQTINKCLQDLKSKDSAIRHRATLIIGKYKNNLEATIAITQALQDPNPDVQKTALLAMAEYQTIPNIAIENILQLTTHKNTEIRRIVSQIIPKILFSILPNNKTKQKPTNLQLLLNKQIQNMLFDKDPIVLKNILSQYQILSPFYNNSQLKKLINNKNEQIKLLAIKAYFRQITTFGTITPQQKQLLKTLAQNRLTIIKKEIINILSQERIYNDNIWNPLLTDQNQQTRIYAITKLALISSPKAWIPLQKIITNDKIKTENKKQLLKTLLNYHTKGEQQLIKIIQTQPKLQTEALKILGYHRPIKNKQIFLQFINSKQQPMREITTKILANNLNNVKINTIKTWLNSKYPEPKILAINIIAKQPQNKISQELLLDAIIDDNINVRTKALQTICIKKYPQCMQVINLSLQDDDPKFQQKTVDIIIRYQRTKAKQILTNFIKNNPNTTLKSYITLLLQNL